MNEKASVKETTKTTKKACTVIPHYERLSEKIRGLC